MTEEITDVADFMVSLLGTDCSGEDELTYLTLRVYLFTSFHMQAIILNCGTYITLVFLVEKKMCIIFLCFPN